MDDPLNTIDMIRKENRCDMTRSQWIARLRRPSLFAQNLTYHPHRDKN